jgi:hypothetical protein
LSISSGTNSFRRGAQRRRALRGDDRIVPRVVWATRGDRRSERRAARFRRYRDYVADDHWQELACDYIKTASVIVMIPGHAHWIQWELAQILDSDCLHKRMFVFPPGLPLAEKTARLSATWQAFRQRADLQPLDTADLAGTVALHFFLPDSITCITDDEFASASRYGNGKALLAAFA